MIPWSSSSSLLDWSSASSSLIPPPPRERSLDESSSLRSPCRILAPLPRLPHFFPVGCLGVVALLWYLRIRFHCGWVSLFLLQRRMRFFCFVVSRCIPSFLASWLSCLFCLFCMFDWRNPILVVSSTEGVLDVPKCSGLHAQSYHDCCEIHQEIVHPASQAPHHLPIKRIVLLPVWLPDPLLIWCRL